MDDVWMVILVTTIAFLLGSLPFAVWLGKSLGRCDVREVGDGNPGTANAFKAAGWKTGVPVLVLELGKACIPVGLAHWVFGLGGWALLPVGLAPVFGHAFSPFLRMRGGKALAATYGSWIGLTGWLFPLALGVCMGLWYAVQKGDAWAVVGGMAFFGVFLLVAGAPLALLAVWLFNFGVVAWKQRGEFVGTLALRSWIPAFRGRRG